MKAGDVLADYWLLDEYLEEHPDEVDRSATFARMVQEPATAARPGEMRPVEVVMVYPGLQMSDYWRRSASSFRARMSEIGLDLTLRDHFTKPGTDIALQNQLLRDAIANPPDYLVFTLDALRHRGMIERVMARGQTKIILQNITTPIRAFGAYQPFLYVGFDHGIGSKMLAERYLDTFPEGARYAIFFGPKGYVSAMRGGVFQQTVSQKSGMELVASYYVNFDRERSYKAAMELLAEQPDLDFIYACSTDIAFGIIDALKETGRIGEVMVNGWGGGSAELEAIAAGELDFTVMRMNDDNGVAMAEAIRLDLQSEGESVPTVYAGEIRIVDQNTSVAELSALKQHAFRYSQ